MQIEDVVDDIYNRLENHRAISENNLNTFLTGIEKVLRDSMEKDRSLKDRPSLRMSSIGKPLRRIWMELKSDKEVALPKGSTLIKFMYGNLLEELLLFLVKEAGHIVSHEQKQVTLNGVTGHIDCKIDNELVDIKSASDFAFRKFKFGSLENDDSFGYIGQLSGYVQAEEHEKGYFLAINKVTGELALLEIDDFSLINVDKRIDKVREALDSDAPPELCFKPEPEGKSGNMRLNKNCTYCPYKTECWPELRIFKYKDGLKYLTTVEKLPLVPEVTDQYM